jgi:hypothetical protein
MPAVWLAPEGQSGQAAPTHKLSTNPATHRTCSPSAPQRHVGLAVASTENVEQVTLPNAQNDDRPTPRDVGKRLLGGHVDGVDSSKHVDRASTINVVVRGADHGRMMINTVNNTTHRHVPTDSDETPMDLEDGWGTGGASGGGTRLLLLLLGTINQTYSVAISIDDNGPCVQVISTYE